MTAPPTLDVVIPVHNEEADLETCVRKLHAFARSQLRCTVRITVADNASTDQTLAVAQRLAAELPEVRVCHLEQKGRGRALKQVWLASDAEVLAYMDVDLSTDLNALLPLIAPLLSGHSQLAIGTRLGRSARVSRGPKRELISRSYNLILRGALAARFSDAQCGFKAITAEAAQALLPLVQDTGWFFDTELLVLAERAGLRIHEVPVDWVDDPNSSVDIVATAVADLKGVGRVGRALATGALPLGQIRAQFERRTPGLARPTFLTQVVRFAAVGVVSTAAYVLLFLLLGTTLSAQVANLLALLLTAVGNTAANRRFTFGISGPVDVGRHHLQGIAVFLLGWAITSGALGALHAVVATPSAWLQVGVLVTANLIATGARFALLRGWVFRSEQSSSPAPAHLTTPAHLPDPPRFGAISSSFGADTP